MPFTEADNRRARLDFPSLGREVAGKPIAYLDGPAGSQVPRQVMEAISSYYSTSNANTHGGFITSRETDALLEECRAACAAFVGAASGEQISFGANMTSLTFSLAQALVRAMQPGDEIVITALDHEANRGPWLSLRERGMVVREARLGMDGRLDAEDFARQVTDKTRVVAVGHASNALGTVNDLALARRLADRAGAWLVVDAVHSAPHFPLDFTALGADFMLCSAYKFYGPHVGVLASKPGLLDRLEPNRLRTQDQDTPHRIETGTLNHAALAGVKAAVDYLATWGEGSSLRERIVAALHSISVYEAELARYYYENVARIPGIRVWGPPFPEPREDKSDDTAREDIDLRAPTVSISIDGVHPTRAAAFLGERGIQVWDGHFYAARAIESLGLEEAGGVLRTGILLYNTRQEVDRLLDGVRELVGSR